MKIFKDWLTGPNNDYFEAWRAMSIAMFLIGMSLVIYDVVIRGSAFNLLTFAQGGGLMLALASGGVALKDFAASKSRKE